MEVKWQIIAIFSHGDAAQRGPWPPHSWGFYITHNDASQSVGLLWTSDQLVAETSTWQHTTLTTDKHPCPTVGFEPTVSAGERPQTYVLDRAATGTDKLIIIKLLIRKILISYESCIRSLQNIFDWSYKWTKECKTCIRQYRHNSLSKHTPLDAITIGCSCNDLWAESHY